MHGAVTGVDGSGSTVERRGLALLKPSPIAVPKKRVCLPSARYANRHTEQRHFVAYLHKYGCLSQDSTPYSQIDNYLFTSHYHIHLSNTCALLFY